MAIWAQAQGAYRKATQSSIATQWKRWGRFAWAVPFVAADVTISRDKYAAVGANVADLSMAWVLRKQKGAIPFIVPPVAYALTRAAVSSITGRGEIKGGTKITQKIASEIITAGESNTPVNPIKGHDAGHWGREQTFASGDFEPGSSWKGSLRKAAHTLERYAGIYFGDVGRLAPDWRMVGREARRMARLSKKTPSTEEFLEKIGVKFLDKEAFKGVHASVLSGYLDPKTFTPHMLPAKYFSPGHLERYAGFRRATGAHEVFEKIVAKKNIKRYGEIFAFVDEQHVGPDVLRGHGMFMAETGIPLKRIRSTFRGASKLDMDFVEQGFYRAKARKMGIQAGLGMGVIGMSAAYGNLFSDRNKPVNPIKGHDAGHWGREQTFAFGDFQPGESWKGIFGKIWAGTRAVGRGMAAAPGMIGRTLRTSKVIALEMSRETRHFIKKELLPGLKKGKLPELGLATAIAIEPTLAAFGLMTPTALSMTAFAILGKGGYMAIKKGPAALRMAKFAKQHPTVTKAVIKHGGGGAMRQIGQYIRRGTRNPAGMFIELGGGKLGRESLKADFALAMGEIIRDPSKAIQSGVAQLGGFDDVYNTIRGLSSGPGAREIQDILKIPFGSGWKGLLSALKRPVRSLLGMGRKTKPDSWRSALAAERGLGRRVKLEAAVLGEVGEAVRLARESTSLSGFYSKIGVKEVSSIRDLMPYYRAEEIGRAYKGIKGLGGRTVRRGDKWVPLAPSESLFKETPYFKEAIAGDPKKLEHLRRFAGGTSVHEKLESLSESMGAAFRGSEVFVKRFGHASRYVPFGEAAWHGGMGLKWREAKQLLRGRGQKYLRKELKAGWKAGRRLFYKPPVKGHDAGRWGREWAEEAIDSDFSSGSSKKDALLTVAKHMGISFEAVKSSRGFYESLRSGRVIKILGKGTQGEVALMESTIKGSPFRYARKKVLPREGSAYKTASASADLKREYDILEEIRGVHGGVSNITPHAYMFEGAGEGATMYMEFAQGKALAQGGKLTAEAHRVLKTEANLLATKGIYNVDVNLGNVLVSNDSVSWIDFGLAQSKRHSTFPGRFHEIAQSYKERMLKGVEELRRTTSVARKNRLNKLQEAAQPSPFELNARRRMSHGVDRGSRTK
jgi:hypothetical protein